jgi:hypothetical protein
MIAKEKLVKENFVTKSISFFKVKHYYRSKIMFGAIVLNEVNFSVKTDLNTIELLYK